MPSTTGIIGTDGKTPLFDPNGRWQMWNLNEVYLGKDGGNKFVPKVGDYVVDSGSHLIYEVTHLNDLNLVPTLKEVKLMNAYHSFTGTDLLLGVGPGTQSDTYRVYLDTTHVPYVLSVDRRLSIAGSMTKYAKIFRGANLTDTGEVVSRVYSSTGELISDTIELELVATDTHLNHSIKIVPTCHCNVEMPDGEIVTCVLYDDLGHVVSKRQLLVENTGFIPRANENLKYITAISLESPYISSTNDYVIDFPVNVPISAITLIGVVTYSDGSKIKLPVDGTKFKMYGLDQYVSTIIGHRHELVLAYQMDEHEKAYNTVSYNNGVITTPYMINTVKPNLSYAVKLYCYPEFVSVSDGYKLNFYLTNLDRNVLFDVTDKVRFADNTGLFNPKGYGYLQRKAISVNLRDVSLGFKAYIHTQLMDIVLLEPPEKDRTAWTIAHESREDTNSTIALSYGNDVQAVIKPNTENTLDITSGEIEFTKWLDKHYYTTYPIIDRYIESRPPVPNFMRIKYKNTEVEYNISYWDKPITLGLTPELGSNLMITFIKKVSGRDLILSVAHLPIVA